MLCEKAGQHCCRCLPVAFPRHVKARLGVLTCERGCFLRAAGKPVRYREDDGAIRIPHIPFGALDW
jgi:hypothetical protein